MPQHSVRPDSPVCRQRHWVDLAMFQLSIVWLADWTPRSLPLILMAIVSAGAFALWACSSAGAAQYRAARLLLAASVAVPLGVFLSAPSLRTQTEFLQVILLTAAGFASLRTGCKTPANQAAEN